MAAGDIICPQRWRPPDPETETAAPAGPRSGGDQEQLGLVVAFPTYRARHLSARTPRAVARPFGFLWATYLIGTDGSETRDGIFEHEASACAAARRLNWAFQFGREARL